jgi:hypothetical protein
MMDKTTDSVKWNDENAPKEYVPPELTQEPLDQPTLVSDTKLNQYKQEKQDQINAIRQAQTQLPPISQPQPQPVTPTTTPTTNTTYTPSGSHISASGIINLVIGIIMFGVIIFTIVPVMNSLITNSLNNPNVAFNPNWNTTTTNITSNVQSAFSIMEGLIYIVPIIFIVGFMFHLMDMGRP